MAIMEPRILYEDEQILVIDKPSGMVVNRADSAKVETVQDWVESYLNSRRILPLDSPAAIPSAEFEKRSGIVHRLDKETSGVLIIAKTPHAFENLQGQFKERTVEKVYLALVHGEMEQNEGTISAPIGRLPWNRKRFGILAGGREAETIYKRIKIYDLRFKNMGEIYTFLELYPKTGRTHQIRVHLKSIGHPIAGDTFYAGRKTARNDRQWCPRIFLHAKSITFTHPHTGRRFTVTSDIPQDLSETLSNFPLQEFQLLNADLLK